MNYRIFSFWLIFKRDLANLALNPVLLIYNAAFAPLLILTLGYLTGGSYDYYGITILIFASLNVSITAANSFMEKSIMATNLRVMYAPIPLANLYLGKIMASFAFTSFFTLVHLLFLQAFGVYFGGKLVLYLILLLLGFNLFSASLGVFFCCVFKSEELANNILSMLNNIFALMGGLFFSWDRLGKTAELIARLSPVKWVADGAIELIYDQDFTVFTITLTLFLILIPALLWGCKLNFKTEDYQ